MSYIKRAVPPGWIVERFCCPSEATVAYKTVLVHADLSHRAPARITLAASLANAHGAHLIGVAATGVSRFMYPDAAAPLARTVAAPYAADIGAHARQALDQFSAIAREQSVGSHEARLLADDPEGALISMSHYADVVVLSQSDPAHQVAGAVRELPEYVTLNVARPVLLVPYAGMPRPLDGKVMVAWDGSVEASRALQQALPLLCQAGSVLIVQFPSEDANALAGHAPDLLAWLRRNGVSATIHELGADIGNGDALLSFAADRQSDLIVMGAYGHSRLRELLLGGVTRTMLDQMTVPVLMAH
jgi:nucleotide-binding universal stress UspA family protein